MTSRRLVISSPHHHSPLRPVPVRIDEGEKGRKDGDKVVSGGHVPSLSSLLSGRVVTGGGEGKRRRGGVTENGRHEFQLDPR